MNRETKLLLGKILGETYRIQKHTKSMSCHASDQEIYGLINGIETEVNEQIRFIADSNITVEDVQNVDEILIEIQRDSERLKHFRGYYDIQDRLSKLGVDRGKAIRIITYLAIGGNYREIINKMDSEHSPTECRRFDLEDNEI